MPPFPFTASSTSGASGDVPASAAMHAATWILPPLIVLLYVWIAFGGPSWNPRVPVAYSGDALFYLAQSKTTIDHGWWWSNPSISAPSGYPALVFAQNTNVDQALVWMAGRFTRNVFLAVNLTWLGLLALSAVTTVWGLRRLGVSRIAAGGMAILFAVSPFAFYRNVAHFNVVTYLLPLPATAALLLASGHADRRWTRRELAVPVLGCLLIGFDYIYFAFFGAALIATGLCVGFGRSRSRAVWRNGAWVLGALLLAAGLNLVPNVLAWRAYGAPSDVQHLALESEVYGLKLRHLLSPVTSHWFPPFREWLSLETVASFQNENENTYARLGIVAAIGTLALLLTAVIPSTRRSNEAPDTESACRAILIAALLLGIVGGFGAVFSVVVSAEIRAYNRISPFIAYCALTGLAVWLDRLAETQPRVPRAAVWLLLVAIGLADQYPALGELTSDRPIITPGFTSTDRYVRRLEQSLPIGAMVFELPIRPYPRDPGANGISTYAHFRAYLSSSHLRWSYPAMTATQIRWEHTVTDRPDAELPARLAREGFSAILIYRDAYDDRGVALATALGSGPSPATRLLEGEDYLALDLRPLALTLPAASAR